MLSKLTSLNAMQIKISFAAAYDFNPLIHAVCSPPRPILAPQILTPSPPRPALWGRGGSRPAPSCSFFALPLPALPRPVKKIASSSIPGRREKRKQADPCGPLSKHSFQNSEFCLEHSVASQIDPRMNETIPKMSEFDLQCQCICLSETEKDFATMCWKALIITFLLL